MANAAQCAECQAILDEFRSALAEISPESGQQFWARRDDFMKMIGGTDEDAERIEKLGEKYRFRPWIPGSPDEWERNRPLMNLGRNPAIQNVFRKLLTHAFRTGHWIGWKKLYGR